MNTSILVVGSYEFYKALPEQIRSESFSVEIATTVDEALSWAQNRLPDILLVQASVHNSEKFCQWSKAQVTLNYPYGILLEDRPQANQINGTWELEKTAAMLEDIADAYVPFLWKEKNQAQQNATSRLILAHIQIGLRNSRKYHELIDKNNTLAAIALADPLTQLNNRRSMERDLPERILESRANKNPLSLLILDVDRFKSINDSYGHLVGDRVLQLLSYRLKRNLRLSDTLFRYGGEEFVIILSNSDCQQGLFIAERLRRLIGEQVFTIDALSLNVTVSIGTTCLQSLDDRGGVTLLDRADRHLLQAKVAGRDRVIGCTQQLCESKKLAMAI